MFFFLKHGVHSRYSATSP